MISKLNFKKRVLASFCLVLILAAVIPFGVFAYRYNGSFSDGESALNYFGLSDTPMFNMIDSGQAFMQIHDNVNDFNNLSMFGLTSSNESEYEGYFNSVKQFSGFNVYKTINPDSDDDPNNPIDISSSTYHLLTVFNNGSDTYAYMYYFWTEDGKPVYVVGGPQGNYIASEGTLHCWANEISSSENDGHARNYDSYVNVNNDGVNYVSYGQSIRDYFVFTDMSVYNATDSGNTGFTNSGFGGGTSDFDFSAVSSYYDFNLPKTSGDFIDPNAPEPQPEQTLARYYMNFGDTTSYTGNSFNAVYHNNSLNLNEYTMQFPQQFELGFDYIVYLDTPYFGGTRVYRYTPENKVQIAYLLGQCKRLGTGTKLSVPLNFDDFICTADGNTLSFDLRSIYHNQFSTVMTAINVDDLLDFSAISFGGNSLGGGSRSFGGFQIGNFTSISDGIDKIKTAIASSFRQFKIVGYVSLYDKSDSNYHSYAYHDFHDFLTGEEGALDTNNTIQPYEKPEELNDAKIIDTSGTGGGVSVGDNNVTVTVQGGTGSGGQLVKVWTPFTLSEVSYANTHGMFQDILEFMDAESQNGFLPVVKRVFSFLPDQIWTYLTISIAVICGFAVVRFVIRR